MITHIPVLTKEVLKYLNPKANENFIDGTVGEAGHALLILEKNKPEGRVLGIDYDQEQVEHSKMTTKKYQDRVILVNDSYANIKEIVEKANIKPVNGILLDLGLSSWQLEQSTKGFSFQKDEMLDMRYSLQNTLTAEKIVNEYPESKIQQILAEYGEERFAKQIAKKIVEQRKIKRIETTFELKSVIEKAVPPKFLHGKISFATRTFQAFRLEVNGELNSLAKVLPDAMNNLVSGGRLVVISFHSLEDRIVKNFFKQEAKAGIAKILTKKPIMATDEEALVNPRSRSAKLRAIVKL